LTDGIVPPCETDENCWIPPVLPAVSHVLDLREKLNWLKPLGIGDSILKLYGATVDTLDLLVIAEKELKPEYEDSENGNGSEMDIECN